MGEKKKKEKENSLLVMDLLSIKFTMAGGTANTKAKERGNK